MWAIASKYWKTGRTVPLAKKDYSAGTVPAGFLGPALMADLNGQPIWSNWSKLNHGDWSNGQSVLTKGPVPVVYKAGEVVYKAGEMVDRAGEVVYRAEKEPRYLTSRFFSGGHTGPPLPYFIITISTKGDLQLPEKR